MLDIPAGGADEACRLEVIEPDGLIAVSAKVELVATVG